LRLSTAVGWNEQKGHPGNEQLAHVPRRQVREMAEKVHEANELITKALRAMIPDPPVQAFLINAGQALDAAEVIANKAPPASTAFGRQGPEVQILSLRPS
jgi:hypothetical protein